MFPQVWRAGEWFLQSGIQNSEGGIARYYRLDLGRNQAVSTEITGYGASALAFLDSLSGGHSPFRDAACAAARFLRGAWDARTGTMPFEVEPAEFAYFFDCGIIVRGLLAVWRATGDDTLLGCARQVGESMARDFRAADGGDFHPILTLPDKNPVERDALRWSRSTGCYQLKSAMAWWDLWEATGDACYRDLYCNVREEALRSAPDFLPGHSDRRKVVDRLHAYLYFLEGLLPMPDPVMGDGIELVAGLLRELAPEFERSDVYAQLLRVRVFADAAGIVKLDRAAAQWEADRLVEFAREDGGFYSAAAPGSGSPTSIRCRRRSRCRRWRYGAARPSRIAAC